MYKGYGFCIPQGKSFEITDIYYYREKKAKILITYEILAKIWGITSPLGDITFSVMTVLEKNKYALWLAANGISRDGRR